jgi:hypothetical protein
MLRDELYVHLLNVCLRCAKLQGVILWVTVSKKFCSNWWAIISWYTAKSILIYLNGCNRPFCNTCFIVLYK